MTRELRIHLITCEITHRSTLSHFSVAIINSCAFHATDARNVCDAEGDRAGDISRVKPFIAVERLGPAASQDVFWRRWWGAGVLLQGMAAEIREVGMRIGWVKPWED